LINNFSLAENNTQLELIEGNGCSYDDPNLVLTTTFFVPLPNEPLAVQQEEPELLWTLHLINVENAADGRAFTLDEEEKNHISAFLRIHNLI
jgi:hypothetical protein